MRLTRAAWAFVFTYGCNDIGAPENRPRFAPIDKDDTASMPDEGAVPTTQDPIAPGDTVTSPSAGPTEQQPDMGLPNDTPASASTPGSDVPAPGSEPPTAPAQPSCDDAVGEPVLRRLTAAELTNTLYDALGVEVALNLPHDPRNAYGFSTTASTLLASSTFLESLRAQVHAAIANVDLKTLRQRYGGCEASLDCDHDVVLAFASSLLRRPLASDEAERFSALWSDLSALQAPDAALQSALEAAALSPQALYRSEVGVDAGSKRSLDPYEIASALAYTFAASAPDSELLEAAANGTLSDPTARLLQARRLLATERGRAQMLDFFRQWWRYPETEFLAKDATTYPAFTPDIQQRLVAETDRFVQSALTQDGSLSDLLLSRDTELDPELAGYYGLAATTDGVARYMRLAGHGVGLLAQGSVLARWALPNSSSPTQRGAFIRRSLLCEVLPAPPPNVGQAPEPVAGVTTRARYESVHAVSTGCAACHQLTDPVGFAFEHFDGAGQYRETENELELDSSGELVGHELSFDGQEQLAALLADLPEVRACLARHWVSFALNVNPAQSALVASRQRCAYQDNPTSLRELFAGYAASSHFAERRAAP